MNPIYVPLLSALAGAIIGSATSIATILIQARLGERRERIRQAAMLALEDVKIRLEHTPQGSIVWPISLHLYHQLAILNAIEENDLTPERLRRIHTADLELGKELLNLERELKASFPPKLATDSA